MIRACAALLALLAAPAAAEPLRIATGGHYPPYIWVEDGQPIRGLDFDLMTEICDRGEYACTWVDLPMSGIFDALIAGEVDVVTGGFGYSARRDEIVDFTCPYWNSGENQGTFLSLDPAADLIESEIGVLDASLYATALLRAGRDIRTYPTEEAALAALMAGEVPVIFGSHNLEQLALARPGVERRGTYPTFSGGTALIVSEAAPDLRDALDAALADIADDGTLSRLQVQWLGVDQGDIIARCNETNALT